MPSPQSVALCRDLSGQRRTTTDPTAAGFCLVMKGSGVRVPSSALRSFPANAVVPPRRPAEPGPVWGLHGVQKPGPRRSIRVPRGLRLEGGFIAARATGVAEIAMAQMPLPFSSGDDAYLTVAEAAARLSCCERTIRRAIESGALRTGRIRGGHRSRGAWRIRPVWLRRT
jgi:excisionase family DNA binding protein